MLIELTPKGIILRENWVGVHQEVDKVCLLYCLVEECLLRMYKMSADTHGLIRATAAKAIILGVLVCGCLCSSCQHATPLPDRERDYRQAMRDFVIDLSEYAKATKSGFLIVPQNGQELVTDSGDAQGKLQESYLDAIDGVGRENMFYGYFADDQRTPAPDSQHMLRLCRLCESRGIKTIAMDYCFSPEKVDDSYRRHQENGFISFAAPERALTVIPEYPAEPVNANRQDVDSLAQAKNVLYLINSEDYTGKEEFLRDLAATDYDLLIIDLFHQGAAYTRDEMDGLRYKSNGGRRLVLCYLSIGEAEDYRYYWNREWGNAPPTWLAEGNPEWPGNYKVHYWDSAWQSIIYGDEGAYLDKIIAAGFDGVYLDLIDAFEFYEE